MEMMLKFKHSLNSEIEMYGGFWLDVIRWMCLGAVFALLGCAVPPYKQPEGGNIATVFFKNLGFGDGAVVMFKKYEKCTDRTVSDVITPGSSLPLKVIADAPVSFSFGYGVYLPDGSIKNCIYYATTQFGANREYEATITDVGGGCELRLLDVTDPQQTQAVAFTPREKASAPLGDFDDFCL